MTTSPVATPPTAAALRIRSGSWLARAQSYGIVFVALALISLVTALQPEFIAPGNIANILSQWAPVGVMAIGMTYVVITGGFDLSAGSVYAVSGVTAAALGSTQAPVVAFLAAFAVGIAAGLVNGVVITVLKVNAFIATLGSSLVFSGIGLVITDNQPFVVDFPPFRILGAGRVAGIPYSGILLVTLLLIAGAALAYTAYGQSVYAVGGNPEASRLAGLRVTWTPVSAYVISGFCAALGGAIATSQLSYAQANASSDLVFNVLTVVVVGGTSLAGGVGAIWRTAVGLAILATLQNGFNLLHINSYYQGIIKGAIIIGALALDGRLSLSRSRR
ncbi:ABC transporter permease [Streptomyces sp. NPDC048504]|uniref:ABC transporter permease n=1 Tax=Streptomyces TaxID=1883 RepID=UPI003443F005